MDALHRLRFLPCYSQKILCQFLYIYLYIIPNTRFLYYFLFQLKGDNIILR